MSAPANHLRPSLVRRTRGEHRDADGLGRCRSAAREPRTPWSTFGVDAEVDAASTDSLNLTLSCPSGISARRQPGYALPWTTVPGLRSWPMVSDIFTSIAHGTGAARDGCTATASRSAAVRSGVWWWRCLRAVCARSCRPCRVRRAAAPRCRAPWPMDGRRRRLQGADEGERAVAVHVGDDHRDRAEPPAGLAELLAEPMMLTPCCPVPDRRGSSPGGTCSLRSPDFRIAHLVRNACQCTASTSSFAQQAILRGFKRPFRPGSFTFTVLHQAFHQGPTRPQLDRGRPKSAPPPRRFFPS